MTVSIRPLSRPDDVPAIADSTWLYTGAEGPPIAAQAQALERYQANRSSGETGRSAHAEVENGLRLRLASLLGLTAGDIALVSNASEAMNLVAASCGLRPGDNVVVNDLEFPSVVQPWLRLRHAGIEVRVARHVDWRMPVEQVAALVDENTRVVAVSHVSYQTGWRHDLERLSAVAADAGALFVVDATQSLGVVPVPGTLADVVVSSSYKWLLGGHGLGVLAWNRARTPLPDPASVGWRSVRDLFSTDRFSRYEWHDDARRFETGFPSYPTIYLLDASTEWLAGFDPSAVHDHVLSLSGRLVQELSARGFDVATPAEDEHRAGNVTLLCDDGAALARRLRDCDIHCWGGDGRLRASTHLFNGDADVDRLLDALDRT